MLSKPCTVLMNVSKRFNRSAIRLTMPGKIGSSRNHICYCLRIGFSKLRRAAAIAHDKEGYHAQQLGIGSHAKRPIPDSLHRHRALLWPPHARRDVGACAVVSVLPCECTRSAADQGLGPWRTTETPEGGPNSVAQRCRRTSRPEHHSALRCTPTRAD